MANQDKFQPVLGGPTQMGGTVAEVQQGKSPLAFLNSALTLGANLLDDAVTTTKQENKDLKTAAKNQMMNDYANELSKLKSAYDQGAVSLNDLDLKIREVTDKYYQQNIVSAKDLHSIRDGSIGTDVSGKRLETDLGIEAAQKNRVITQRNTIIDNAKKNNPAWALLSDEAVMTKLNKVEMLARNLTGAIDIYNQIEQADDKGNKEYAKEGVLNTATDLETENTLRGIMNGIQLVGPEAVFNPEALAQNKQLIYKRLTQDIVPPVEASIARAAVDRVMEVTGYSDAVELVKQGVIDAKEFKTNLNLLTEETLKQNINVTAPTMVVLGSMAPETQALVLGDNELLTTLQNEVKTLVKGGPVNTTGNVKSTQLYGALLQGAVNGDLANIPAKRLTTMIQGAINNTSLPENVDGLSDDEVKTVEKNTEVSAKVVFDPGVQAKVVKEGSPENKQNLKDGQKKVVKTAAEIEKQSKDAGQWASNFRYDTETGSVVLIGDEGGTGLLKAAAAPYSATIVEKMNETLDWIRSSAVFNEREKKQYVKDCLEYWGITELAEGESRTGLGGLTVNKVGEQLGEVVEASSNFLTKTGELFGEAVLAQKDPNYRGPIGKDIDTVIEHAPELGKAAKDIVTSPGEAVGEAVAELVLNIKDREYSGKYEQAIDIVYDALPDTVKKFAEAPGEVVAEINANIKDPSYEGDAEKAVKTLYDKVVPQWLKEVVESPVEAVTEFVLMRKDPTYKGDNIANALRTLDKDVVQPVKKNVVEPVVNKAGEISAEASTFIRENYEALKGLGKEKLNQLVSLLGSAYKKYLYTGDVESEEDFKQNLADSSYEQLGLHTLEQQQNKKRDELLKTLKKTKTADAGLGKQLAEKRQEIFEKAMEDKLVRNLEGYSEGKARKIIDNLNASKNNTKLTEIEERKFQRWLEKSGREGDLVDYDLRGAWKDNAKESAKGHLPDKYKKPNHPTFSVESIYYKRGMKAGKWIVEKGKDVYLAPEGLNKSEREFLKRYFKDFESDSELRFVD